MLAGDNIDKDIANYERVYNKYEEFKLNVPYKLGAQAVFFDEAYANNYADNYQVIVDDKFVDVWTCDTLDINVKPQAETEILIDFDASKLTKEMLEKVYDGKSFDISEAVANGFVIVTDTKSGKEIPVTGENAIELSYVWVDDDSYATAYPVNANEYVLYVSFAGDDNYRPASNYFDETFRIIPRDIIVKPVLSENIVAGWYMGSSSSSSNDNQKVLDHSKAVIEGYIEADAEAFAYKDSVYNTKAFTGNLTVNVTDKDDEGFTSTNDRYLRTGKEYRIAYKNIKLDPNVLSDRYEGNYNIISESVKFQPNKRGNADVYSSNYYVSSNNNSETIEEIKLSVKKSDLAVEIKPLEGISYYYGTSMAKDINKEELKPGNYFVLNIGKPTEFRAQSDYAINVNAIYKNSIEKAGGYVLYEHKDYILVAIDAAPLKTGENIRKFDIIWEDGYTESFTVDLREAQLEADLRTAKAPKSLSFNRVNSKMIVGENQQLDVKLTKYIINDLICLNYKVVSGQDIVSVTNTGYVTALKKGTATVEVYPVKYDNKGNEIRLDFKSVTTKLTVSDVTAPKINKVYAYDTYTDITYTKPSDGYRREIYILEGKGYKPNDFETKIANMSQGSFEGIKIDYVTEYDSYYSLYDYSKNQVTYTVTGLKPNTDYTVYVRNVSGIHTNAQDDYVTASKAGSVKSFKTTKAQIYNLGLYFDNSQQIVYNADLDREEASLSKNKIKVSARGYFDYRPENVAADETDGVVYNLPLDKKQQNTYLNPKLSYYVVEDTDYISGSEYDEMKEFLKLYYTTDFVQIGDRYYTPSSIAKIDKKGNIKLNGTGYIYIIVYDNARKIMSEPYELYIKSGVTKITAKNITLKVGELKNINNVLTFYDGNKKFSSISGSDIAIKTEVISGDGIQMLSENSNTYSVVYGMQSNKSAVVKVSLADNPNVFVNVNIKTKPMNPVKGLKATDIMDDRAVLTFTHDASAMVGDVQYRIEIKNARNEIVSSELLYSSDMNIDLLNTNISKGIFGFSYVVEGLTRKSDYKISVTPVYGMETAKASTVKIKTTEIPAYKDELLDKGVYGGMDITSYNKAAGHEYIKNAYFTSGKLYTFIAHDAFMSDYTGDWRPTDILTWKSSNKKVAAIKANPGTYTASFEALSQGYTDIEVYSKLRKGVIARYRVRVKAVGEANKSDFGDYALDFDPYYNAGVEVITEANPVRADQSVNDYKWVKFEAPEYGYYKFKVQGGNPYSEYSYYGMNNYYKNETLSESLEWKSLDTGYESKEVFLNQGDTIYIKVFGNFTMSVRGEKYSEITTTTTLNAKNTKYIMFTAPEDNSYVFNATKPNKSGTYGKSPNAINDSINFYNNENDDYRYPDYIYLKKGETLYIKTGSMSEDYTISVSARKLIELKTSEASDIKLSDKWDFAWYSFTAPITGEYTIKSTDATAPLVGEWYNGPMDAGFNLFENGTEADNTNNISNKKLMNKGETAFIRIYTNSEEEATGKLHVIAPKTDTVTLDTPKTITVNKDEEIWVSFTAPQDNAKYMFSIVNEYGKIHTIKVGYYTDEDYSHSIGSGTEYSNNKLKKGETINIKITLPNLSDSVPSANVIVKVSKAQATEIKVNQPLDLAIEDFGLYFYQFTAPSTGLYEFRSKMIDSEIYSHRLLADKYDSITDLSPSVVNWGERYYVHDFYKEVYMLAGETVIFAVKSNDAESMEDKPLISQAKIMVSKVTASELQLESPKEITLGKGSVGDVSWYKFTAKKDGNYTIKTEYENGEKYEDGLSRYATINYAYDLTGQYFSDFKGNLSAGETVYLRLVSEQVSQVEEQKIKITIIGAESIEEELPNSEFEVAAGETKAYKFTALNPGRYKINFKTDIEDSALELKYSKTSDGYKYTITNNGEIVCTKVGESYYFYVENTDSEKKARVKLALEKVTAAEINTETTSITVKPSEPQWFAYTVPESGRYIFTAQSGENNDKYDEIYYYDKLTDFATIGDLSEKWLNKSRVIYIKINNVSNENTTVKLSIKPVQLESITVGTEKEAALKINESKWYKFIADETGYYKFEQGPEDFTDGYYYVNLQDDKFLFGSGYVKLQKNDNIYIKITRDEVSDEETITSKLLVKKETVVKLEEGKDLTITTKLNERQYVSFTPSKSAYYAIGVKDVPGDIAVSGNMVLTYSVQYFDIGEEVLFYMGANFLWVENPEEAERSYKLYVEEVNPTALTLGKTDITAARYQRAWYTFEAPEDGIYNFTCESENEQIRYEIYSNGKYTYKNSYGTMPYEEVRMTKDKKLTIAVYYQDNKSDKSNEEVANSASFKLNVTKTEIKPMEAQGTTAELEADTSEWYSYTVPKTGEYTFVNENGSMTLYKHIGLSQTFSSKEFLTTGTNVYIKLTNNDSKKQSVKVTVTANEALMLTMDNAVEVGFTADELEKGITYKWISFTADKTGYYIFSKEDTQGNMNAYYNDTYSLDSEYFVSSNKEVYIKVVSHTPSLAKISVAAGNTEFNYNVIGLNQKKLVKLAAKEYAYYKFTAPASGNYAFYSTTVESSDYRDSCAYLYNDEMYQIEYDDDDGEGSNFMINKYLLKDETVYIKVKAWGSEKAIDFNLHVTLEDY